MTDLRDVTIIEHLRTCKLCVNKGHSDSSYCAEYYVILDAMELTDMAMRKEGQLPTLKQWLAEMKRLGQEPTITGAWYVRSDHISIYKQQLSMKDAEIRELKRKIQILVEGK